ncbi:PEP/pyruvate-binding domain-containing protein [Nostoc sp. TCL26-01]|uniref:PEP/pyruvate-binding domain-containing protein n=1 Tax=Nostoc sp. TCL26-01 TaxID=2576904 RepID=UPI0015B94224|nr:PEP/pyruvate-binding domain-containing protein [Nostoc sp. TCL26-01]QLE54740.1 hypothetical protein FD725_03980 [Nostoc sp. TCL26-01]
MVEILLNPYQEQGVAREAPLVLPLNQVGIADISLVGEKNASLGEITQQLRRKGVKVPMGFATTTYAYKYFMTATGLEAKLRKLFADLDVKDRQNLRLCGVQARQLILQTPFPIELQTAIAQAYANLCQEYSKNIDVVVGSSTIGKNLSDAGQEVTYVNVQGLPAVLEACHQCLATIFTDSDIAYRQINGFDQLNVALSISIQKMVRSDLAAFGFMFSVDTETGFKDAALITAYSLSTVNAADEYLVFKPTLKQGYRPIIDKRLGTQQVKIVDEVNGSITPPARQEFTLNDEEILQLAHWACIIEEHYSQVHGVYTPMDIAWAKDGVSNELFIVQASSGKVQLHQTKNVDIQDFFLEKIPSKRTQIMINLGSPEAAFDLSVDLTANDEDKVEFFVDQLAQSLGAIAAAFYPKTIAVFLSDFNVKQFESQAENPISYRQSFALECQAIKRVRDEMGLTNIILMLPCCHTPDAGRRVLIEMAKYGLVRGENGLQVYVMSELPNNVELRDEFSQVFDDFSICFQTPPGLNRDSEILAHLFYERDEAVKRMMAKAIATIQENGHKISICNQASRSHFKSNNHHF